MTPKYWKAIPACSATQQNRSLNARYSAVLPTEFYSGFSEYG